MSSYLEMGVNKANLSCLNVLCELLLAFPESALLVFLFCKHIYKYITLYNSTAPQTTLSKLIIYIF